MAFTVQTAVFVSFFIECVAYGLFASLFAQSTSIILARNKRDSKMRRVNMILLSVSVLMFLLSTVYVTTGLYGYPHAFRSISDAYGPSESQISAELQNVKSTRYIIATGAYGLQTVLGDGFMIYRTYVVWGGYLPICILPLVTFLVSTVSGIIFMFIPSHSPTWVLVFLWLTFFTNGCCTALIAGRIIWLRRQVDGSEDSIRSSFGPTVTLIVESGAIYSISLTGVIALYYPFGLSEQNSALRVMPQVMGIIFSFIIIRVASQISSETLMTSQSEFDAQRTIQTEMLRSALRGERPQSDPLSWRHSSLL